MIRKIIFLFILSATISACGGGGGGSTTAPAANKWGAGSNAPTWSDGTNNANTLRWQ